MDDPTAGTDLPRVEFDLRSGTRALVANLVEAVDEMVATGRLAARLDSDTTADDACRAVAADWSGLASRGVTALICASDVQGYGAPRLCTFGACRARGRFRCQFRLIAHGPSRPPTSTCGGPRAQSVTTQVAGDYSACLVTETSGVDDRSFNETTFAGLERKAELDEIRQGIIDGDISADGNN